jgi:hypothetical protein
MRRRANDTYSIVDANVRLAKPAHARWSGGGCCRNNAAIARDLYRALVQPRVSPLFLARLVVLSGAAGLDLARSGGATFHASTDIGSGHDRFCDGMGLDGIRRGRNPGVGVAHSCGGLSALQRAGPRRPRGDSDHAESICIRRGSDRGDRCDGRGVPRGRVRRHLVGDEPGAHSRGHPFGAMVPLEHSLRRFRRSIPREFPADADSGDRSGAQP